MLDSIKEFFTQGAHKKYCEITFSLQNAKILRMENEIINLSRRMRDLEIRLANKPKPVQSKPKPKTKKPVQNGEN